MLRRPYALDATVQNLAARQTGRWGGQLRAQAFGLTGLGDATYVSLYSTADFEEQQILQAGHSFRPGSEGLIVHGQATYAWTKPDIDAAPGVPTSRRAPCSRRWARPIRSGARRAST